MMTLSKDFHEFIKLLNEASVEHVKGFHRFADGVWGDLLLGTHFRDFSTSCWGSLDWIGET